MKTQKSLGIHSQETMDLTFPWKQDDLKQTETSLLMRQDYTDLQHSGFFHQTEAWIKYKATMS